MIRLTGVTQHYGVRPVLEDISLAIETGKRVDRLLSLSARKMTWPGQQSSSRPG